MASAKQRVESRLAFSREGWSPEQLAFIMSGKWYLVAHFAFQMTLVIAFVVRARAGVPLMGAATVVGAVLFATGYALRRWTMRVLGERFRGYEVRKEERGLERRGPFAAVRHPNYLGLVLMDVGFPVLLRIWWGLALSIVLIMLILRRIRLEEVLLRNTYSEYADFARTRKRLIPGVW